MTFAFLIDSVPITKAVRDGATSLGGSESACFGLARALQARGHDVTIFARHLEADARGYDAAGVLWHSADDFTQINQWVEWDVVVALRQFGFFGGHPVHARFRILWNQDLLMAGVGAQIMSVAWALDRIAYVSDYHRRQWEGQQPELAPIGWATTNGYDPSLVPTSATKDPNRIVHISRPERGLGPLLAMWPTLKMRHPAATLQICRYQSMYDGEGSNVRATCLAFDAEVERVNAEVGGITYLGQLNKTQLYHAIAEAAVMWYPGIDAFAETSCIAAIEAQACGTAFIGSWKGALPETVPSGVLIKGDARTPEYQQQSISAVVELLAQCRQQAFDYRKRQQAGRAHVKGYTFDAIAGEWEAQIARWFNERYQQHKPRILAQLLHDDDHVAAKVVAAELGDDTAEAFCDRVIAGQDQSADDYAAHAIQDPLKEIALSERFKVVNPHFKDCTRVLDVACGNGAFAIGLALAYPQLHVHGMDYAAANIAMATDAAQRAGVSDRCTFEQRTVYDFDTQEMHDDWMAFRETRDLVQPFDGLFVGEFVEHVANCTGLVDGLEAVLTDGAKVVYTCPHGPFTEMLARGVPVHRGHVHNFKQDDVKAVWGGKLHSAADYFSIGVTQRGAPVGHWIIHYEVAPNRPAGYRDLDTRARHTRPLQKVTAGLIVHNAEHDLGRCLQSIWHIADEILVGDTGSTDKSMDIALSFGAKVLELAPIRDQPEGFAGARNAVLEAATGDWFLWIDADEQLLEPHVLRRYLEGPIFNGFVLHQTHLYIDQAPSWDIPVRVFRTQQGITFYGCVHEQPQQGDANADIFPTLEPFDLQIAHTGYLTNDQRESKRRERNYPLILLDQKVFPGRILGKLILLRETVLQADHETAAAGGLTARAERGYEFAIRLWDQYFTDPGHKLHPLGRPWYEAALRGLGLGVELEVAIAGKIGGLAGAHAKPERIWVRSVDELDAALAWQTSRMRLRLEPAPVHTDPFPVEAAAAAEVPA